MVFTASLLGARHLGEIVENKPASSLVVSLGKALNGTPPSLCGRQVAQFFLSREGWWQEGHPTVKTKMPCYKNADYLLWQSLIGKSRKKKKRIIPCCFIVDLDELNFFSKTAHSLILLAKITPYYIHIIKIPYWPIQDPNFF